ncbi:MAG: response regulator [Bacteroidota bacterium]|nr:response regulator [Bacteroidota bacterium]
MTTSLKRNLLVGFGISLLILVASSIASYISISNLIKSAGYVDHTNAVVQKLEQAISQMKDAETGQRGYLLTGKEEFLQPYNGSLQKEMALVQEIKTLTAGDDAQQTGVSQLNDLITKKFTQLQDIIDQKRKNIPASLNQLMSGKAFMDSARLIVSQMVNNEDRVLKQRTENLQRFSLITPVLIVIAALLAILISVLSYIRMYKDIKARTRLQKLLEDKDAAISYRLNIIQDLSEKISKGDYSVRVNDKESDSLGIISASLNSMASSLESSFKLLSDKEWLREGMVQLNDAIIGDDNLQSLSQKIITFAAEYSGSHVGAFYIRSGERTLNLQTGYALQKNELRLSLNEGEGLVGECARTKKIMLIHDVNEKELTINLASAGLKPENIIVLPLLFENVVNGVIELGALHTYSERELDFFKNISENIGIAVNTVQSRQRVQQLLEETQTQSEELMSQQSELEQINIELEDQAQRLQTSEEELKVQSEELIETNTLLEEKSASLEQRNQLILQKNSEIEKKAADLALSTKYKSEFLANMSHELRTPLNSILLLSQLMSENNEKNLTPDQVQYAKVIQSSGNGLLQLIDEILDLSKIEAGKMIIENLPVKIREVTEGVDALFKPLAIQQKLEWKITINKGVPATMETDKMRLEQILKNLLSNAFKFTSKGHVHLSVSLAEGAAGYLSFTVADSGIGIIPEKQDLIFEAFQQEDGTTRRKFGGTGLGLSISRELAKLLGGKITLKSAPGEGSEFTCRIPVKFRESQLHQSAGEHYEEASIPQVVKSESVKSEYSAAIAPADIIDDIENIIAEDKVILIVEDDIGFAGVLLDYTRQRGYKGIVAVRGDKGIELASKYLPSGILLDIQLPVKNGWEVMEALKGNMRTRHIPVHIMSSFEVKKESLLKGAVDFINKPVAFDQLKTIFEKLEFILSRKEKKVLIVEENYRHAKALAYYLGTHSVHTKIFQSVQESVASLHQKDVDCVILDTSVADKNVDHLLETIRSNKGMEQLPIILFTGKNLTQPEEFKIKKYADAIVMKTANSYQRILDEVSLFLHLVASGQNKLDTPVFEQSLLQDNTLKGKNILLADDDVRNIYSMTQALEKYQVNVIPAMDGREALQLIKTVNVDLVLMDMMMPEMDGYETIKAIRENPLYNQVPVIAVTAKAMRGDREKCIAAGASDYISKPVDTDQLVSLLRVWLYDKGY